MTDKENIEKPILLKGLGELEVCGIDGCTVEIPNLENMTFEERDPAEFAEAREIAQKAIMDEFLKENDWPEQGETDDTFRGTTGPWNNANVGELWLLRRMDMDNELEQPYTEFAWARENQKFELSHDGHETGWIRYDDPTITRAVKIR